MSHQARRFHAAVNVQRAVKLEAQPPFIKRGRATGRFAVGIRYEREVQEYLSLLALGRADLVYLNGPWLEFSCAGEKRRWCQPDAVILNTALGLGIVQEVKYQHTPDAWRQLTQLYVPVLKVVYPQIKAWGMVEIVNWHDPQITFPEPYEFTPDPFTVRNASRVAVHIYNPKRAGHSAARLGNCSDRGEAADRGRSAQTNPGFPRVT